MTARAIARHPSANFGDGLTSAGLGAPNYALACRQHAAYCDALRRAGMNVTVLDADTRHPDAHFVEDVAVIVRERATLTRPGAPSRRREVQAMRAPLAQCFASVDEIVAPGTLDGGDVCDADDRIFIGISARTNEDGARQLARIAEHAGKRASLVDIRSSPGLLHLKSAMAYIGENRFVATEEAIALLDVPRERIIVVSADEAYGANCVRVNDVVLVASAHPQLHADLSHAGFATMALDITEFRKMDGGLSCLSLRF